MTGLLPMQESRRYSNPPVSVESLIELLMDETDRRMRQKVLAAIGSECDRALPERPRLRPRQGVIQGTVFRVLGEAEKPLRMLEIRRAVEQCLKQEISEGTIYSCLSVAAHDLKLPVVRVGRGLYVWRD
jgi:hypothetical protein